MTDPQSRPASAKRAGRQQAHLSLQQQAAASQQPKPYDWAADPIWSVPVPEPPDWDNLSAHEQDIYKLAAIAYALRAVADTRGVSAASLLTDWNHGRGNE